MISLLDAVRTRRCGKMLNSRPLAEAGILEASVVGIPRVAKAMEDLTA
jgi:hypothetical protein